MTETEDQAGKFDEHVAATIRTAVDEWRIHDDPADAHDVGMPEYIRQALADAGLLAQADLTKEVTELRADKDIRQDALNNVLGRERTADYYSAVDDVAQLVRAHRQLIAEAERLRLERADVRGLIQSVGEEPLPADVPTQQAVAWLVDEYKKLEEQNEELLGEQDETLPLALLRQGARDALTQIDTQGQRIRQLLAENTLLRGGSAGAATGSRPRPPFPYEARRWMDEGARVECFSGKDPADVIHEGWIIGMTEAPTVRVQKDDGRIVSWVLGITRRQSAAAAATEVEPSGQLQANSKLEQNLDEERSSSSGFAPDDLVRWIGDTGWFEGRILGLTSDETRRSGGFTMLAEKMWDVEVTDLGTFYANKDRQLGAIVHVTEEHLTTVGSAWKPGDIVLDQTNFVWQRYEYGWRTVPRDRGVQYEDEQLESLAGPLMRIAAVPVEVDDLGAVPADVAERLRAEVTESTSPPQRTPRLRECVENWPACETGAYNPSCCRFPKSCSATIYDETAVKPEDLEAGRG